jgi:hypothetical protein
MRTKVLLGAAVVVAALIVFAPSKDEVVAPVHGQDGASAGGHPSTVHPTASHRHYNLADRIADATSAASLFAAHSWYTPPPPPPPPPASVLAEASSGPPAPVAPPLPFAYMGSYTAADSKPVYFLTANDRTYDVKLGDTLDGMYTLDKQVGNQLVFTYKPLNTQQFLAVEVPE